MLIPEIVSWAKKIKYESRETRMKYAANKLPKIDNYIQMIIDRGEIIQKETLKMQRFMEDIEDALKRLSLYGVNVPTEPKQTKVQENPLLP